MANYVKFKQGLKKDFNTTNQPLTNGMVYFVIDENNHGSIYYDTIVDGKKATKNGTVHRVKFSGLPIKITGSVIGTGVISQDGETIEINTSTNHSHGLAHQDFTVTLSNDDTNLKWTRLGNQNGGGFWLKSIRGQAKAPAWFLLDYSAGIAFGGADTKGVISVRYGQPSVRFAGGNGSAPVWYFTITGAKDKTYDLSKIGGHSSDSAKLDHNVTFKITSTADATKGGSGTATNLSGSAVDLYLPTKISGFDLLQATRFQGNADSATVASKANSLFLNPSNRQENINYQINSDKYQSRVTYSLASSITKTGKPPVGDSHVLTFGWDGSGWGAQLAINTNAKPHIAIRGAKAGEKGVSIWDETWSTVLDSSNYTSYINNYYWADVKVSTTANAKTNPNFFNVTSSGWFFSNAPSTGWQNSAHGGGIYMKDSSYVRIYGGKKFAVENTDSDSINTTGGVKASGGFTSDAGTMKVYAEFNNEINFGGTNPSNTIYFGHRKKDSKEIPSIFIFGSNTGTANIQANAGWFGQKYLSGDNWIGWYATKGDTSSKRYGYIQTDISDNGNMRFVKEGGGYFTFNSHVNPNQTNAYDLGTQALAWRTLYVNNLNLYGQTANRLVWTNANKALIASNHYAASDRIAINSTSAPGYNFYVNGTSYFNGQVTATQFNGPLNGNAATATNVAWSGITNKPPYYDIPRYAGNIGYYESSDTHILKLGYWNCTGSYDNLTLLVSSSFWGNQHGSTDIITLRQDLNDNSGISVKCSCNRVKLMDSNRIFYYNIDQTNRRVYLYVYVIGGNSYGKWNTSVLQSNGGSWISEFAGNQPNQSSFVTINGTIVETTTNADTVDGYHADAFVKKAGDTMTGDLHFRTIGQFPAPSDETYPINSAGITWGGSSDYANIYYEVAAADTRRLVFNTGDDSNCIISFRNCGTQYAYIDTQGLHGAVWNDYAECRKSNENEPGRVVLEDNFGVCQITIKKLQPFAGVISDTYGFCQGETNDAKTPLAVAGRVLVYTYQNKYNYKIGDCVCAAPNGTVDIMTREEVREYPDRIVGTVSEIPDYEVWGTNNVKVNNRIWIKVK